MPSRIDVRDSSTTWSARAWEASVRDASATWIASCCSLSVRSRSRGPPRALEVGRVEGLAVVGDVAELGFADDAHDEHERDEEAGAPEELGADGEATRHACPGGRPLALALEQPEDPADDLALDLPPGGAVEEVADRAGDAGAGARRGASGTFAHGDVLRAPSRPAWRSAASAAAAPRRRAWRAARARSRVDAACRTSRTAARPSRRPRRRRPGPSATPARRRRAWTTGVGTPFSLSSVTAASPVPIEVSSSSTS